MLEIIDAAIEPMRSEVSQTREEVEALRGELAQRDRINKITLTASTSGGLLFALTLYSLLQSILRRKSRAMNEPEAVQRSFKKDLFMDAVFVIVGFLGATLIWWMLGSELL